MAGSSWNDFRDLLGFRGVTDYFRVPASFSKQAGTVPEFCFFIYVYLRLIHLNRKTRRKIEHGYIYDQRTCIY